MAAGADGHAPFPSPATSGLLLAAAAGFALLLANSPLRGLYESLLTVVVEVRAGTAGIEKPLLLWINDGLMALFFLTVGLEIKREIAAGHLSRPAHAALPAIAATGGVVAPALIYVLLASGEAGALPGWAIPCATDIAFAVGVAALLGPRVPASLRAFLLALAIIDDLAAIVIIAAFYTGELSFEALLVAGAALAALAALNRADVRALAPYVITGLVLWVAVLKSGVHATLAGVALGFAVPLKHDARGDSPALRMEQGLHPWVALGVLPLFAFANAGVPFDGLGFGALVAPVPLGIALGLFLGKQAGVFGATWATVRLGIAPLPRGADWRQVYGVAVLTGIGFTMSLFIGTLAFPGAERSVEVRLGVLLGSLLSVLWGVAVLAGAGPHRRPAEAAAP